MDIEELLSFNATSQDVLVSEEFLYIKKLYETKFCNDLHFMMYEDFLRHRESQSTQLVVNGGEK